MALYNQNDNNPYNSGNNDNYDYNYNDNNNNNNEEDQRQDSSSWQDQPQRSQFSSLNNNNPMNDDNYNSNYNSNDYYDNYRADNNKDDNGLWSMVDNVVNSARVQMASFAQQNNNNNIHQRNNNNNQMMNDDNYDDYKEDNDKDLWSIVDTVANIATTPTPYLTNYGVGLPLGYPILLGVGSLFLPTFLLKVMWVGFFGLFVYLGQKLLPNEDADEEFLPVNLVALLAATLTTGLLAPTTTGGVAVVDYSNLNNKNNYQEAVAINNINQEVAVNTGGMNWMGLLMMVVGISSVLFVFQQANNDNVNTSSYNDYANNNDEDPRLLDMQQWDNQFVQEQRDRNRQQRREIIDVDDDTQQ